MTTSPRRRSPRSSPSVSADRGPGPAGALTLGPMMIRGTGSRWLVAALTASAVLTSGCTHSVDTEELPGTYRDDATGGEIQLASDGTFAATDVSTDSDSGPADFSGRWTFVD